MSYGIRKLGFKHQLCQPFLKDSLLYQLFNLTPVVPVYSLADKYYTESNPSGDDGANSLFSNFLLDSRKLQDWIWENLNWLLLIPETQMWVSPSQKTALLKFIDNRFSRQNVKVKTNANTEMLTLYTFIKASLNITYLILKILQPFSSTFVLFTL